MDALIVVFLCILGACVGSFLNVLVLRFGFRERPSPRSKCASCTSTLSPRDLIPVVSYVLLRARCRTCGSRLSIQYPVVELLTAGVFLLTYAVMVPQTPLEYLSFVLYLGFWSALVALIAYDVRHTLIPLPFVYALWVFAAVSAVVGALALQSTAPVLDAAFGMVCVGGFFAALSILTRGRGMGIGDAYVGGAIGLMLGSASGIVAAILAVWIGAVWGLVLIAVAHSLRVFHRTYGLRRVTLKTEIPFAPFLALGAMIAFATGLMPLDLAFWVYPF